MLDDTLRERIESKKCKNFWHLFDSLILYGYPPMDSLGVTLSYFGETDIWKDVAYAKIVMKETSGYVGGVDPHQIDDFGNANVRFNVTTERVLILEVGIIDKGNQHLLGLFDFYRKSLVEGKLDFNDDLIQEVEDNCVTKYHFYDLPQFIMLYLSDTSKKHFGYDVLDRVAKEHNVRDMVARAAVRAIRYD